MCSVPSNISCLGMQRTLRFGGVSLQRATTCTGGRMDVRYSGWKVRQTVGGNEGHPLGYSVFKAEKYIPSTCWFIFQTATNSQASCLLAVAQEARSVVDQLVIQYGMQVAQTVAKLVSQCCPPFPHHGLYARVKHGESLDMVRAQMCPERLARP